MSSSHPHRERSILVVTDDPAFARSLLENWGHVANSPELRVVSSADCIECQSDEFQFIVLGGLQPEVCAEVLAAFRPGNTPLVLIGVDGGVLGVSQRHASKILLLPSRPSWQDMLLALGTEVTRRAEAQARARRAEMRNAELGCEAALGQYVIDMRHNLNNALTSVLGNAELLLLDETKFSVNERKQIDTIRLMALRMHETLQRFSSLEKELRASSGYGPGAEQQCPGSDRSSKQDREFMGEVEQPHLARAAGAD